MDVMASPESDEHTSSDLKFQAESAVVSMLLRIVARAEGVA